MRRPGLGRSALAVSCIAFATLGCSADDAGYGSDAFSGPSDPGVPSTPPSTPPPTGSKWQGVEISGDCGRTSLAWVLVDEMCGGTDDPGYLDALRVPMFRDGAVIGDALFTVDATHLWVLDVADPAAPARQTLAGGLAHPIAVGTHAGRLVVAAGDVGLVLLDVTSPEHPAQISALALPGPALDVSIDGDRALVPMGKSGVAVVDLSPTLADPPSDPLLVRTVPSPGFAVGVAAAGSVGYVAACDTFASVDLETGALLAEKWLAPYSGEVLVAPAKDVTVVGSTAYVAAGRYGAVALDVENPAAPQLLGDCTIKDDLAFYASGVRAEADKLYIAGGEWGILAVDVGTPGACGKLTYPMLPPQPTDDDSCDPKPPWTVVPWEDTWAPPPPPPPPTPGSPAPPAGKDPVQTLPAGDVLYAFGDARRLGVRAVDVRSTNEPDLAKLGRYEEPRLVVDIAASAGRVLVLGPAGGLFLADDTLLLAPTAAPPEVVDGVAATTLADGRWAFATTQALHVEDASPISLPEAPPWHGLSSRDAEVVVAGQQGVRVFDVVAGTGTAQTAPKAELPLQVLARSDGIFLAAPEWERALRIDASGSTQLDPNGVFGAEEILDANLWREGLPRRLLADSPYGVVEIATLGTRAGLTVHDAAGGGAKLALPPGTYVDAASQGDTLFLVLADRNVYRSALLSVKLSASAAQVIQTETFTGIAMGVAVDALRLYVADADRGVRVYSLASGVPAPLGVVDLEPAP